MVTFVFTFLDSVEFLQSKFFYIIFFLISAPCYYLNILDVHYYDVLENCFALSDLFYSENSVFLRFDALISVRMLNACNLNYSTNHQIVVFKVIMYFFDMYSFYFIGFFKIIWWSLFYFSLLRLVLFKFFPNLGLVDISALYSQFEHNVGNSADLVFIATIFVVIIFFNINYFFFDISALEFKLVYAYMVFAFVLIPIRILLAFGSNLLSYVSGTSSVKKFSLEVFKDAMSITVFLARFFLQLVRIILIYVFYFFAHEFVFVLPKQYIINLQNSSFFAPLHFFQSLFSFLRWIIEFIDTAVTIINQIASFSFVVFWLFSYINTCELKRKKITWFNKLNKKL